MTRRNTASSSSDLATASRIAERVLKIGPDDLDLSMLEASTLNETLELLEHAIEGLSLARVIVLHSARPATK